MSAHLRFWHADRALGRASQDGSGVTSLQELDLKSAEQQLGAKCGAACCPSFRPFSLREADSLNKTPVRTFGL